VPAGSWPRVRVSVYLRLITSKPDERDVFTASDTAGGLDWRELAGGIAGACGARAMKSGHVAMAISFRQTRPAS